MNSADNNTSDAGRSQLPEKPLELSPRIAWIAMAVVMAITLVLASVQISRYRVASEDACAFYLPLAREVAKGNWSASQLPSIPPLYPIAMGMTACAFGGADQPIVAAGQVINVFCLMVSIVCVFLAGKILFNYRVALAAAVLAGANFWLLKFTANVGPELFYTMLLTLTTLLLTLFLRQPGVILAAAIGVVAAMAMLTRSEGIVIIMAAAMLVVVIGMVKLKGKRYMTIVCLLAMLAAGTATFWPRLSYVHSIAGHWVPDIRLLPYMTGGKVVVNLRDYPPPGHDKQYVEPADLGLVVHVEQSSHERFKAMGIISDLWEGFVMVFGPATVVLAICWLVLRTNVPKNRAGQLVMAAIVFAQIGIILAAIIFPMGLNEFSRRYTICVSVIVQIWGALGLVTIGEWLRTSKIPVFCAIGGKMSLQLALLGVMLVGLATVSLLVSSYGERHGELAGLGQYVQKQYGSGQRILATTAQSQFYADGIFLSARYADAVGSPATTASIAKLCRERHVDFIVAGSGEKWCQTMLEDIANERLPVEIVLAFGGSGKGKNKEMSFLIDARKLILASSGTTLPTK